MFTHFKDRRYNFKKVDEEDLVGLGFPYDLKSVMQYGSHDLKKDVTIRAPNMVTVYGEEIPSRVSCPVFTFGCFENLNITCLCLFWQLSETTINKVVFTFFAFHLSWKLYQTTVMTLRMNQTYEDMVLLVKFSLKIIIKTIKNSNHNVQSPSLFTILYQSLPTR